MEVSRALKHAAEAGEALQRPPCPRCDEPGSSLRPVIAESLGRLAVTRCCRCGTRTADEGGATRFVFTCACCGLPYLADRILPHSEYRCGPCRSGQDPAELPDGALARAMEEGVRAALASRWRFVTSPSLTLYLQRIVRQIAGRIENAPPECRVVLVDDWSQLTLALPSGLILVSLGTLAFLEDEAELVFVLAHELAHAASGDAAVRLARLGCRDAALESNGGAGGVWGETVMDLVRLGYGRVRERDADTVALEAMLALGYDPVAAGRYLERVREQARAGAGEVAELCAAHPPPEDRARRIDRALFGRLHLDAAPKTNREVFRRAAGYQVLAGDLVPVELNRSSRLAPPLSMQETGTRGKSLWMAVAVAALAAVILVVGLILAG